MIEQLSLFTATPDHRPVPPPERKRPCPRHDGRGRHSNSLAAHDRVEHVLSGRRATILAWVLAHGPATDRQILAGLYHVDADPNLVRPRVSEMLDAGDLVEHDHVRDETTGMPVRRVVAAPHHRL